MTNWPKSEYGLNVREAHRRVSYLRSQGLTYRDIGYAVGLPHTWVYRFHTRKVFYPRASHVSQVLRRLPYQLDLPLD